MRERRQTYGMSHEKKLGLRLHSVFFFLLRSLFHRQVGVEIVVRTTIFYASSSPC
jgi:hypothetical protein